MAKSAKTDIAGKLDQLMDELPVKRRAKIEARANELGLPADMPHPKEQKGRAGGKHAWRFRSHFRRAAACRRPGRWRRPIWPDPERLRRGCERFWDADNGLLALIIKY